MHKSIDLDMCTSFVCMYVNTYGGKNPNVFR